MCLFGGRRTRVPGPCERDAKISQPEWVHGREAEVGFYRRPWCPQGLLQQRLDRGVLRLGFRGLGGVCVSVFDQMLRVPGLLPERELREGQCSCGAPQWALLAFGLCCCSAVLAAWSVTGVW